MRGLEDDPLFVRAVDKVLLAIVELWGLFRKLRGDGGRCLGELGQTRTAALLLLLDSGALHARGPRLGRGDPCLGAPVG